MCKFFEGDKPCPLGNRCHFAHGRSELRKIDDPLPQNTPYLPTSRLIETALKDENQDINFNPVVINNYKTVICKYWEQGKCKFNQNCSFAHGDVEVRNHVRPRLFWVIPPGIYTYDSYIFEHFCSILFPKNHLGSDQWGFILSHLIWWIIGLIFPLLYGFPFFSFL